MFLTFEQHAADDAVPHPGFVHGIDRYRAGVCNQAGAFSTGQGSAGFVRYISQQQYEGVGRQGFQLRNQRIDRLLGCVKNLHLAPEFFRDRNHFVADRQAAGSVVVYHQNRPCVRMDVQGQLQGAGHILHLRGAGDGFQPLNHSRGISIDSGKHDGKPWKQFQPETVHHVQCRVIQNENEIGPVFPIFGFQILRHEEKMVGAGKTLGVQMLDGGHQKGVCFL